MAGKQRALSWVLVGVSFTELGMPALSTLCNNFGDWRLAGSFLKTIDCGLLPALLGLWLAGL